MATHIWYSGATDITGRTLAEQLQINGARERPRNLEANDIVIGWGTKTNQNVNLAGNVLNHPNAILKNRNKFKALELMKADRNLAGNIAFFCKADQVKRQLRGNDMDYPIIGRKNYHQSGKGFWLCVTSSHLEKALAEGAQYFQVFMDIETEYRLHVFCGKVIYAVKKVENATEVGWCAQRKEKIMDYAQKNNVQVDQATIDYVLGRLYKEQQLPDMIVRSNHRGWKFSSVAVRNLSAALKNAAIKAVEVVGLDFGAVDCCVDMNSHPWIIEINSGPGLQGTTLEKYVEALRAKIAEIQRPAQREAAPRRRQPANNERRAAGAAAVGADNAGNAQISDDQLRLLMNEVQSPEEARRVLDIAMGRG